MKAASGDGRPGKRTKARVRARAFVLPNCSDGLELDAMPRYHNSHPAGSPRETENFHIVRSDTFKGSWRGVYKVSPDGSCHLLGRTVKWEPLALVRSRALARLGGAQEVRP